MAVTAEVDASAATRPARNAGIEPNRITWDRIMRELLLSFTVVAVLGVAAASATAQGKVDANSAKIFKGYALTELSEAGLLYNAKAKEIYYKALGLLVKEPWLAKLDGPSPMNKAVKVAGTDYVLLSACKNRDCEQNSTVLLYSVSQDVVYGKVYQRGKSTLIGSPSPAIAAELEKLWKSEWRSQPK
jgi:hypothetical protein